MPHLVIQHSANVQTPIAELCDALRNCIVRFTDAQGQQPFPMAGTRVLAFAAGAASVANGDATNAFVYLNLRIARGRPQATVAALGDALVGICNAHFSAECGVRPVGITLQIDEGDEVFNAKIGNLHPNSAAK